ncbi:MAG TPA: cytochrome c [Nitrospira sp.]|nr:cytochrome c [Nitrospira sp.]
MEERDNHARQAEVKVERSAIVLSLSLNRSLGLPTALAVSFGMLFVNGLATDMVSTSPYSWAEPIPSQPTGQLKGNIMRGREIFNGKGVCYYCHGIDGYIGRRPRLETDTASLIAKLNPPPPDLRNPEILHLKTNKERSRAIREGHPGTGMFPDTTMTDQDLADTLLYLALIRKDPHPEQ